MCGEGYGSTPSAPSSQTVWASIGVITKADDTFTYYKDFQFTPSGNKYCGGIQSDGQHMYVLVFSNVLGDMQAYVYMKDIIFSVDDHLTRYVMSTGGSSSPYVNRFLLKSEEGF